MIKMYPYIIWSGITVSVYSALMTEMIYGAVKKQPGQSDEDHDKDQAFKSAIGMALLGLGEVVGAFFVGYCIDLFGSKKTSLVNLTLSFIALVFCLEFLVINEFNVLTYLTTFFWGVMDSGINTHQ